MRIVAYTCTAGHAIPAERLDELTEVVTLDGGAEVRICAEHGAPIALTLCGSGELPDAETR